MRSHGRARSRDPRGAAGRRPGDLRGHRPPRRAIPSSVHERVRKLEQAGVIRAYRPSRPARARSGRHGPHRRHASGSEPTRRPPRACRGLPRGRGLLQRRRRGQLHPQGARTNARAPGGSDPTPAREGAVQTRTTVVLSIPFEGRPLGPRGSRRRRPPRASPDDRLPTVRLFNTLTRRVDEVVPVDDAHVRMYTCGPTVYRYAHIGNLRTFLLADLVRRGLEFEGYRVTQVLNITDVGHMTDEASDAGRDHMDISRRRRGPHAAGDRREVHAGQPRRLRRRWASGRRTSTRRRPTTSKRCSSSPTDWSPAVTPTRSGHDLPRQPDPLPAMGSSRAIPRAARAGHRQEVEVDRQAVSRRFRPVEEGRPQPPG